MAIDWQAIRKANERSRKSSLAGKKTLALLREKARSSPDYAVIANPGSGFVAAPKLAIAFHGRKVSE